MVDGGMEESPTAVFACPLLQSFQLRNDPPIILKRSRSPCAGTSEQLVKDTGSSQSVNVEACQCTVLSARRWSAALSSQIRPLAR